MVIGIHLKLIKFLIATCQSKDHRYLFHFPNSPERIWKLTNTTAAWQTIKVVIFRLTNSCRRTSSGEKMFISLDDAAAARVTQPCNGFIIATQQAIRPALFHTWHHVGVWTGGQARHKASAQRTYFQTSGGGKELAAPGMKNPSPYHIQPEGALTQLRLSCGTCWKVAEPSYRRWTHDRWYARLMAEIPELSGWATPDLIRRFHAVGMVGIQRREICPENFATPMMWWLQIMTVTLFISPQPPPTCRYVCKWCVTS